MACATQTVPPSYVPPRWTTAKVAVTWYDKVEAVTQACQQLGLPYQAAGCARTSPVDDTVCEVHAPLPASFEDKRRLEIFGHEVLHCFGAKHD
jgi:hypothetical protein